MESHLSMTVDKYCEVTGLDPKSLRKVATPSVPEEAKWHPARAPHATGGSVHTCTWCNTALPVDKDGRLLSTTVANGSTAQDDNSNRRSEQDPTEPGGRMMCVEH